MRTHSNMMDEEIKERARNAIRLIFEAAAYEVEEVDAPLDLSATKEGICTVILVDDDPGVISTFNVTNYSAMSNDKEIHCQKLLFTPEKSIRADHCVVWHIDEFVRHAGEAVLARVFSRELSLSIGSGNSGPVPDMVGIPADDSGISLAHLPVKVQDKNAKRTAGVEGQVSLRFMPYWMYHYLSTGEQTFRDKRVSFDADGSGAINAINGIALEINIDDVVRGPVPGDALVEKPHLSRQEAHDRIIAEVTERLTQHVRSKQEKGDAIFYEEKVLKPDKSNIRVDLEEIYIPVWQIRGKKIVEVNAYSGEVLSEPMDEGVEVF